MQTLNLEQLKTATAIGGVTGITLRGDGAAFLVSIQTLKFDAVLATSRKQPRRFADPRKALQLLRMAVAVFSCSRLRVCMALQLE